jgi:hypothetical protein
MRVTPGFSALFSSSCTTEAGRSITSPAAIWLINSSGSLRIGRRGAFRDCRKAGGGASQLIDVR